MSDHPPDRHWWQLIRRSAVLRNAVLTMLVAMIATSIALTVQYRQTVSYMEGELHESVEAEMSLLVGEYGRTGVTGLSAVLKQISRRDSFGDVIYVLSDSGGQVIAGNLKTWPAGMQSQGWAHLLVSAQDIGGRSARWIEANSIRLGGGQKLLVARPADSLETLRQRYVRDLVWSLLITAVTGLSLGWIISRRIFGFINRYADATRRFQDGDLSARVPLSQRGDEFDQLGQMINTATDMTERTNATLRAATDSLAHDLKTPITRMRSRLELALHQSQPENLLYEPIQQNIEDIDSLLAQINAMLQVVRAESITDKQFQPLNLARIVTELCETFEPVADDKNVRLDFSVMPVSVSGVPQLLAQAIANLIDNAIKYTPAGGHIAVSIERQQNHIRIIVADSGPGIPPEDRARAMERFVRLDNSRTSAGSGLGLHYVSTVARVHHGRLELGDNGPGLRATLILPQYEV